MLWTIPGRPRKWSPWKWDTKTRETCMKLSLLSMNCRCVPSPQSNRMTSGPRLIATALTFRFGVGHDPEVPRKTTCMDRSRTPAGLNAFWTPRESYIAEPGCRGGSCMRSIDGRSLDLDDVVAVARQREPVRLDPAAAKRVDASRRALEKVVAKGSLAYGIKTGFGELANVAISDADVRALQLNLLRSHAIGLGPPLRRDEVRAALLLRANTLAMGYSGVRRILVTRLLDFLNLGVHPVIPSRGSLGASGDLAPLAHLGLVLVGEGEAEIDGQILPGAKTLAQPKLAPPVPQPQEGPPTTTGTSGMARDAARARTRRHPCGSR